MKITLSKQQETIDEKTKRFSSLGREDSNVLLDPHTPAKNMTQYLTPEEETFLTTSKMKSIIKHPNCTPEMKEKIREIITRQMAKITAKPVIQKYQTILQMLSASSCVKFKKQAGEDWELTDAVKKATDDVVQHIKIRGGKATKTSDNTINVEALYVDKSHAVPLKIELFEGTYYPGKVIINATFELKGQDFPLPIDCTNGRQSFDAKEIVDAVVDAFMSLVNWNKNNA